MVIKGLDNLSEKAILKRNILLKTQAIKLIRGERKELRQRLFLLEFLESLEQRMGQDFDRELSEKIDCVNYLLSKKG